MEFLTIMSIYTFGAFLLIAAVTAGIEKLASFEKPKARPMATKNK